MVEMQGRGPRDLTKPEDCPHCGLPCKNHIAMWRHKQRCDDNPDPACRWCGLKFEPHKRPAHERKCPKNLANLPTSRWPRPSPWTVPRERLTATDLLVLPLMVDPQEPPPPISEMARPSPVAEEPRVDIEALGPMPFLAPKPAAVRGPAKRPPAAPPVGPSKAAPRPNAAPLHASPGVLREAPLVSILRLLWRGALAPRVTKAAERPAAGPDKRPPYNPMIHGSVEAYCAAYGLPERRQDEQDGEDDEQATS